MKEGDTLKFIFIRRTTSLPKVEYIPEVSSDCINFTPVEPSAVITLNGFYEEVQVILSEPGSKEPVNFARVRVVAEDEDGDGF